MGKHPDVPHGAASDDDGSATLRVEDLRERLRALRLGNPLLYLAEVDSTNTYAATLATIGATEGTLITADHQTVGRGRVGRAWQSVPGQQLALSLILRPPFSPHLLMMASALAVAAGIEDATGLRPALKWPNDVLVNGRKVCGILIETSDGVAILGMGVNVSGSFGAASELAARAITLEDALGHPVRREPLAAAIITRLDGLYRALIEGGAGAHDALRDEWRARLSTLGAVVTVHQGALPVTGLAEDVESSGALILRSADGMRSVITWGDVEQ